ncbi:hypothetical protein SODG_007495 [Sodalis praecaptivus]
MRYSRSQVLETTFYERISAPDSLAVFYVHRLWSGSEQNIQHPRLMGKTAGRLVAGFKYPTTLLKLGFYKSTRT